MTAPRRTPAVRDVLVALVVAVGTLAVVAAAPSVLGPGEGPVPGGTAWWLVAGAVLLQGAALVWAGVAPRVVLVTVAAVPALLGAIAPTGVGNLADVAVLVAVLRATALRPPEALRVVLPAAGVLVAVGQALDVAGAGLADALGAVGAGVLQAAAIVAVPAAVVLAVTARREARRARTGELAAIDRERDALVRAAVADERTAMARELHDIAAHHVSSIALMAGAIDRQIDTDPEAAKRAVREVRGQSRALLDDLRRLVGLLREDAAEPDAVETLAAVPALVAGVAASGRVVALRTAGDGSGVGPLAQLVAYRAVQEALANAAAHAPGAPCTVELDGTGQDRFVVTVRNEPAGPAERSSTGGFGLVGMRERADLVGARLDAGPTEHGGWLVRLELPVGDASLAGSR